MYFVLVRERADGEHASALRLLLGSVGEDDPARRRLLLLEHLDDQTIAQAADPSTYLLLALYQRI